MVDNLIYHLEIKPPHTNVCEEDYYKMVDKTKTYITKYSLYDMVKDTKELDTLSTCEYISSLVTNMKWHYEKEESNKIILIPLYTKTSDVEKK